MNTPTTQSKQEWFESRGISWEEAQKILDLYKEYKGIEWRKPTKHHLIPVSRHASSRVTEIMDARDHWNHHGYLGDQVPWEQVETLLRLNKQVLKRDVVRSIRDTLHRTKWWIYTKHAY